MSKKIISQREAQALRRRVQQLEEAEDRRRNAWAKTWPGGVHLTTLRIGFGSVVREVLTARKLRHAVVVIPNEGNDTLDLYALPLPGQP